MEGNVSDYGEWLVDYLRLDEADQQVLLENHTDLQVHAQSI